MNPRECTPGTVALVRYANSETYVVGIRTTPGANWRTQEHAHTSDVADARPVVVIDPEDREQVERLVRAYFSEFWSRPGAGAVVNRGARNHLPEAIHENALADALRSLLAPPKPPEPKGLGAVVEAVYDNRFVRVSTGDHPWQRVSDVEGEHLCAWSDIAAVKVLSEGVTA